MTEHEYLERFDVEDQKKKKSFFLEYQDLCNSYGLSIQIVGYCGQVGIRKMDHEYMPTRAEQWQNFLAQHFGDDQL